MSTRVISKANRWLKFIQYTLLPATCIQCRKPTCRQRDLCLPCEAELPWLRNTCQRCALPLPRGLHNSRLCGPCLGQAPLFHFACAAFSYEEPVSKLITAFKHHGQLSHGRELSACLGTRLCNFYQGKDWPQVLVPVPLHPQRLRQRGFNQALEIARQLSRSLRIPLAQRYCRRQLQTESQQGLHAAQRRRNLRAAFCLDQPSRYQVRSVALIDDVMTTMSTANELSRVLLKAGVREIHVWTLARALKA